MSDKLLEQIDANVGKVLDQQKELEENQRKSDETIKAIKEQADANATALAEQSDKLTKMDDWIADVEKKVNDNRKLVRGTGESDVMLNAIPDRNRKWVELVRHLQPGINVVGKDVLHRTASMARYAQDDPVRYVAIGSYFQCLLKRYLAGQRGDVRRAESLTEELEKLAIALGGFDHVAKDIMAESMVPYSKAPGDPLETSPDASGGYLVPTITEAMIGWLIKDASTSRAAGATILQMQTMVHELPNLNNDFEVFWADEGQAQASPSEPDQPFGQAVLTAKKMIAVVTISIELIQDNIVNLMDFLMAHLLNKAGGKEDMAFLDDEGAPAGITGMRTAVTTHRDVGGQNKSVDQNTIPDLVYAPEERSAVDTGVLVCHPWIARDLIKLSTGSVGGAVYTPFALTNNIRVQNIYGIPYYGTARIDRTRDDLDGAVGGSTDGDNTCAIYGNMAYSVVGDRMGSTFDVNPYGSAEFKAGQVMLRLLRRVAFTVWVEEYFSVKGVKIE